MASDIGLEKPMPYNLEAERAVLGAILLDPTALCRASECMSAGDLYLESHRIIWGAFEALRSSECPIDLITVIDHLTRLEKLEAAGGHAYISSLSDYRSTNARAYADIIKENSILRRIIQLGNDCMGRAYGGEETSREILESLQLELVNLNSQKRRMWLSAGELMDAAYKTIEDLDRRRVEIIGIASGFSDLDRMTGGFKDGQLIVVAGRPSEGKTSIVMQFAAHAVIRRARKVGVFSLEMGSEELAQRMICCEAEIDSYRIGKGLKTDEWSRIAQAASEISKTQLWVDEIGCLTLADLRNRAQALAIERGLDMLVIDYLQLMSGSERGRSQNRVAEVSEISRGLKRIARELQIPVIAVSQMNRNIEGDKRQPRLSDLRESGSIEQDADIVLFVHRIDAKDTATNLIIGKQRNGPKGQEISLRYLPQFTKFVQAAKQDQVEAEGFSYSD